MRVWSIGHLEVEVRGDRVARISHQPDHLTWLDIVTNANLDASWVQMRIQRITLAAEIQYHRIAVRLCQREIARELAVRLLGQSIQHRHHTRVSHRQRWFSKDRVAFEFFCGPV